MDQVTVSYLAAGFVKNEPIYGHKVTVHTIDDITTVTVYGEDDQEVEGFQFRDAFRTHRLRNVTPPDPSSRLAVSADDLESTRRPHP